MSRSPREGSGGDERETMDPLLSALRGVAREEDAVAAACPDDQIPEISVAVRERITAAALRQLARAPAGGDTAQPIATATAPLAGDQLAARRDRLRSRRMVWSVGSMALAAAAALVLWNRAPTAPAGADGAGALPDYAVTASGGRAETRGVVLPYFDDGAGTTTTTTAPVRVDDSSELRVVCRPDSAVVGAVAARTFLVRDGTAAEVIPEVKIAATGAVELRLRGSQLRSASPAGSAATDPAPRRPVLRIIVGRPDAIRAVAPAEAGRSRPDDAAARRWLTVPLDLDDHQR